MNTFFKSGNCAHNMKHVYPHHKRGYDNRTVNSMPSTGKIAIYTWYFVVIACFGWISLLSADEINVYSYRQNNLIKPIFDNFTKKTGIRVNVLYLSKGLEERIELEGELSPADLLLSSDVFALEKTKAKKLTEKLSPSMFSTPIERIIQDRDGHWIALTTRARIVYASKKNVANNKITSYLDLADASKLNGKICMRSGTHRYNLALTASMLIHYGEKRTESWLRGLKSNLGRRPQGNDRSQIKAVKEGICDYALGNSYYFGLMAYNKKEPKQVGWANAVYPIFPSGEFGVHINISGMALIKTAPNRTAAIRLMNYLLSDEGQKNYAELNYEFPAVPDVKWGKKVAKLFPKKFTPDSDSLSGMSAYISKALELTNRVGFDK